VRSPNRFPLSIADPGNNPAFIYPVVYMCTTLALVAFNVFFGVNAFSLDVRIRFGYVMFLAALAAVPVIQHFMLEVRG
jgi:hypothetical protein